MGKNSELYIAPSILAADFGHLTDSIKQIESISDYLHIDVMDGHYVPNISVGVPVIKSIRSQTNLPFDVHLMITNPLTFIQTFAEAGADLISFHIETVDDPLEAISQIHSFGKRAGIAIHPDTDIEKVFPYLHAVELVLVMSVRPGFGGQRFMNEAISRIALVREKLDSCKSDVLLSVDGGISEMTAPLVINAGANHLVMGNFIFGAEDPADAIRRIRSCVTL